MMSDLIWFARHSWPYLGCDQGTGRWAARRRYIKGFATAYRTFAKLCQQDRKDKL